jgi:chain length determinant protein EpsF
MATQVDVLQSERVALRAIDALQLDRKGGLRERWQLETEGKGDFRTWLAEVVLSRLEAKPARDSNVIAVAYTAQDPAFAATMVNALVSAYIDTSIDLRVEPAKQYTSFFDERAKQLRESLEQAQAKLSAYQKQNGIIATDERLDVENSRLAELSTQLVALQAVAEESRTRQGQTGANSDRMQEVLSSPLISGMTAELSRQEARLNEIQSRLGEQHPDVLQLRASIEQMRARIASETRRVTGSVTVNNNVNQTRVAQLRASLEEQRAKVLRLRGQRDEAAVLLRDVENAQRTYDAIFARVNQTSLESQNTQTNVSVLKRATPPVSPSSPKLTLNAAVAVVLGLLLGLGTAFVRELMDKRLRSDEDVMLGLKQPLLGVLPVRPRASILGHSRARLVKSRILGALPRPAK